MSGLPSIFGLKSSDTFSYLYQTSRGEVSLEFRYSPRDDLYFMDIVADAGFLATNLPVLPGKSYKTPTFARLLGYRVFVSFHHRGKIRQYDKNRRAAEQIYVIVSED